VVALARRALQTRRVGHAGTLDPMATGLLVLAVGEGLKAMRYLALDDKRYHARLRLGIATDSLDADGAVQREAPVLPLQLDAVRELATRFVGPLKQRAPAVSAIKQDGVSLHRRVRRGEAVEPPVRDVVVHALEVLSLRREPPEVELEVSCGKGFYVRALGRDLAEALGTVGHLGALRRLQSGHFRVEDSVPGALLKQAAVGDEGARSALRASLLSVRQALPGAPVLELDAAGVEDARHGRAIAPERIAAGALPEGEAEPVLLVDDEGRPVALARATPQAAHVVRGFR
jgi:tRNA pseudouridine55 synthase